MGSSVICIIAQICFFPDRKGYRISFVGIEYMRWKILFIEFPCLFFICICTVYAYDFICIKFSVAGDFF